MEAPADIYSLAKQALRVLVQRQPVYFAHSASLFDDLRSAHSQRRQIPIVYEFVGHLIIGSSGYANTSRFR